MLAHTSVVHVYSMLVAATFAGLWQGAVLALLTAALLRVMPRASASLRHIVLLAVFAVAAVLPWLHWGAAHRQPVSSNAVRIAPWCAAVVAFAWITLSCIRACALLFAWFRLRTLMKRAVPLTLEGAAAFAAGNRRALLCASAEVDSPTIIGFFSPRLLLPVWMVPLLTEQDLHQIALHECEHLRRYDDWLNLLLQIGLALSPLNPALAWLNGRISMQRELACDAAVVASTAQPIAYASCLTRLAEQRMQHNRFVLALGAWGKQSELVQRVHALLSETAAWTDQQSRLAVSMTAAILLSGAIGLAKTPLFIRVAAVPQAALASAPASIEEAPLYPAPLGGEVLHGTRAMPASFIVKPEVKPVLKRAKRNVRLQHKPSVDYSEMTISVWSQPRLVRTSTGAATHPKYSSADLRFASPEDTVRFVPTDFSLPYVAVPVANGWLVFTL